MRSRRPPHRYRLLALALPLVAACGTSPPPDLPPAATVATVAPTASAAAAPPIPAAREDRTLLARTALFGNADRRAAELSPDGKHLGYLAPSDGIMNVWVAPSDAKFDGKPVTKEKVRGIRNFTFAHTSRHALYLRDPKGDDTWQVMSVDVETAEVRELTPAGQRADLLALSPRRPNEILVTVQPSGAAHADVLKVDVRTGKQDLALKNDGLAGFVADLDLKVRVGIAVTPTGGRRWLEVGQGASSTWKELAVFDLEDTRASRPIGVDAKGVLHFFDSRGRDKAALSALDLRTKKATVLAEGDRADLTKVLLHPRDGTPQAVASAHDRLTWKLLEPSLQADLDLLAKASLGDVEIEDRTLDDKTWLVSFTRAESPKRFFRYDRGLDRKVAVLFSTDRLLETTRLTAMHTRTVPARDKTDLVAYLSLPLGADAGGNGRPAQPLPMILLVHGGPWERDLWGMDKRHQWLASRGYAVLSVNFRGSTGLGKKLVSAGDRGWGTTMQTDLVDAAQWAVAEKIADPGRIAIVGNDYGGYAALMGLGATPGTFACGVDLSGPSDLPTFVEQLPSFNDPPPGEVKKRLGDPGVPAERQSLLLASPITVAKAITKPLLVAHGARDVTVRPEHSERIVGALPASAPVTYVLFPDEGNGTLKVDNRVALHAVVEGFLAQCLGGSYQPIGDDLKGSSLQVKKGAEHVPGLRAALDSRR